MVEARESEGDRVDFVVKLVVGKEPVDVPVEFRAWSVGSSATSRISIARPRPTSLAVAPPPGTRPIPTSTWPSNVFSRAANRRSQATPLDSPRLISEGALREAPLPEPGVHAS